MCSDESVDEIAFTDHVVIPDEDPFLDDDDTEFDIRDEKKYRDSIVAMHAKVAFPWISTPACGFSDHEFLSAVLQQLAEGPFHKRCECWIETTW